MSFNTALSSPQQTQIHRARWQGDQLVSMVDNIVAFEAVVSANLNSTGGSSTAAVPYSTVVSGSTSNLDEGMVCIISPNSDIRNVNAVRLHLRYLVADGSYVYTSEFSDPISSGAHVFCLYSYDIIDNLSRPVGTSPVIQYQQYDQSFQRMAPVINGPQTGYASWVDVSTGYYSVAFDLSTSFSPEYGASISSYLATVKATGAGTSSVTSGALNTSAFTLRVTYGEYWVKLTATDSNGVVSFRHVLIKAHDPVNYPPTEGFEGIEIIREVQGGPSARIKAFTGVSSLLNGTLAIIWVDEAYSDVNFGNYTTTPIVNNIDFIGWIEAEENMFMTDPTYSAYAECQFELQGVGSRLSRLEGQLLAFFNDASPSVWDHINKLTVWRAIIHFLQRHSTVLQLCGLKLNNMSADETFLFPTLTTAAGRALDNVTGNQGLAEMITGQLEFAADGRMEITRKEPFVAGDLSHTPVVVATWTGQDITGQLRWKFNHYQQYGSLMCDGAFWDGTSPAVQAVQSRAPGLAQGSGPDQGRLNNQVLASTSNVVVARGELAQRGGTQFRIDNETGEITVNHFSQLHWLIPSFGQVYVFNLDTTFNIRGLTLNESTNWMCKRVTVRHDNKTGLRDVEAVYTPVVIGTPGMIVQNVPPGSIQPIVPILPPMPAFPGIEYPEATIPDTGLASTITDLKVTLDGNCVLEINNNGAALSITRTFITLTTPLWADVTPTLPSGYTLVDACFDQFVTNGKASIFALANNGTDSLAFYTPDALSQPWVQSASIANQYALIRTTKTPGTVMIYSTGTGTWEYIFDFTVNNGSWAQETGSSVAPIYTAGVGWEDALDLPNSYRSIDLERTFTAAFITSITITYDATLGAQTDTTGVWIYAKNGVSTIASVNVAISNGTNQTLTLLVSGTIDDIIINVTPGNAPGGSGDPGGSALLTKVTIEGTDTNPFGGGGASGGGSSGVRVSTDYAATFGGTVTVGTTPGAIGGFDVQSAGTVSVAAADHAIYKAATLGGAYSSWVGFASDQVICLVVPWYRMTSDVTTQVTASDPDVLFGLSGVATGGSCVGWVDGPTNTIVYKTQPVAGAVVPGPDCLTVLRGTKVAGIFDVGGIRKLYVSEDSMTTWTLVEAVGPTATLRCRRGDDRTGSHRGQILVFDGATKPSGYSSQWANNGEKDRVSAYGTCLGGDVLG